ncbi:MAG: ComEA family DNA-binding protein [Pyrinomonadaceae bacterium]
MSHYAPLSKRFEDLQIVQNSQIVSANAVNINTATAAELEKLPRVGPETARKIIEYREKYGKFRRTENLILVDGMSDKKFRGLQNLVRVE